MFDYIINKLKHRQLRLLIRKRGDKRIENWNKIRTIGIVFVVGSAEKWDTIGSFVSAQEKKGKKIFIIGLHPTDYNIDYIFTHTETTICQEKKDFNFIGIPKKGLIDHFIDRHYDLLVDTTEQPCFFGKYITAVSDADLKVGYSNSNADDEGLMEMYDLTIMGDKAIDFQDYTQQIVKYLSMIKKQ